MRTIGLIVKKQAANAAKGKGKGKKSAETATDPQGPFLDDVIPEDNEAEAEDSED